MRRPRLTPRIPKRGTLYTSYFGNIKNGIGHKFNISRYPPKWLTKGVDYEDNLWGLAPSYEDFNNYKTGKITEEKFRENYARQLIKNEDAVEDIKTIEHLLEQGEDVTVYCWEKPPKFCHRYEAGTKFRLKGFNVVEI